MPSPPFACIVATVTVFALVVRKLKLLLQDVLLLVLAPSVIIEILWLYEPLIADFTLVVALVRRSLLGGNVSLPVFRVLLPHVLVEVLRL